MNTHDMIELPPLPKASKMYDIPGYDEEELKAYARAAVEADRQRLKLQLEKWYEDAVEYQQTGDSYYDGEADAFDLAIQIVDGGKK